MTNISATAWTFDEAEKAQQYTHTLTQTPLMHICCRWITAFHSVIQSVQHKKIIPIEILISDYDTLFDNHIDIKQDKTEEEEE